MQTEVHDAIESVVDHLAQADALSPRRARPRLSFFAARRILLAIVRELPEHMTVLELREEIE